MIKDPAQNLICRVRNYEVKCSPEELVRQSLLTSMIQELGYPPGLLVVEKKLSELAGFSLPNSDFGPRRLPNRRIDILSYGPDLLKPLLLIECKAQPFSTREKLQLLGYNYYVRAGFLLLASPVCLQLFTVGETVEEREVEAVPHFENLVEMQKNL